MYAAEYAKSHPEKPAIVMAASGEVVTFGQYEACANRVAHMLRGAGLQRQPGSSITLSGGILGFGLAAALRRRGRGAAGTRSGR